MDIFCQDCLKDHTTEHHDLCIHCNSPRLLKHSELYSLSLAHIDCDSFYASVEKRDRPELLSKPVIIGVDGGRSVVSTCCYIARSFGVKSAMPMFTAKKLCPEATIISGNMQKYSDVGLQIREIFRDLTPAVEPLSIDEAFLDLKGTTKLHGQPPAKTLAQVMTRIEKEVGITVSVGLSYNKFLAKLASDLNKPRGFSIIGEEEAPSFLKTQPISKIWGVGKVMQKKMIQNGISHIGQLQTMELKYLCNKYGIMGERLYYFSRGKDVRTVKIQSRKDKSISNEHTLRHDVSDYDALLKVLWPLCEKISARLKEKNIAGRTVTLKLKTANFRGVTRSITPSSPVQMAETLYDHGQFLLAPECKGLQYRLIGIGVSNLCSEELAEIPDLLDDGKQIKIKTEKAIDKIRKKFGKDIIKKGRSLK